MPKFNYDEHKKRMRELLQPPQISPPAIQKLREVVRRRKPRV